MKASNESRRGKGAAKPQGHSAIARSGHTNRGRVKQKSHKAAHILEVGSVRSATKCCTVSIMCCTVSINVLSTQHPCAEHSASMCCPVSTHVLSSQHACVLFLAALSLLGDLCVESHIGLVFLGTLWLGLGSPLYTGLSAVICYCRAEKGWFNSGYIFPEGFKSQLPFRWDT